MFSGENEGRCFSLGVLRGFVAILNQRRGYRVYQKKSSKRFEIFLLDCFQKMRHTSIVDCIG